MKKILLDTNFLMICFEFKVDIFSEIERICNFNYKLYILNESLDELNHIVDSQKGKNRDAAKIALKLISIKDVQVIKTKSDKNTDDIICDTASKENYIVATQDKDLKRKLIDQDCKIIILKQKKVLAFINDKGFI